MEKYVWEGVSVGPGKSVVDRPTPIPDGYELDPGPFGAWHPAGATQDRHILFRRLLVRIDRALVGIKVNFVPAAERPEGVDLTEKLIQGRGPISPDQVDSEAAKWMEECGWTLVVVTDGRAETSNAVASVVNPAKPVQQMMLEIGRVPGVLRVET